ncbi:serine/threonine protein kinase [Candidatus Rhodobacter oscarellae]|uniref:Serine/threonine protein kinase n=1 Tax=Candidatus Rhodobacter oscarellae TaxID=1675527 RepID=A0A0J9E7J8_9RHOB|nr:serine/threonine-protein kinase [Candidatus Rhodobacter lobularis]KMW58671.1 serine/threonine protein kinase [Candidatus Rhodobacter lobularis]
MNIVARSPRLVQEDLAEDALRAGDLLLQGQYRIEQFLGAGGFGITYRARDCLDRGVVIKECFPNSICRRSDKLVRTRSRKLQTTFEAIVRDFGMEARRMARLVHPNIVGVHQVFEENGTAYMALDMVPGRNLLDIVESDPEALSPDDIQAVLRQLLDAVAYLHDRNILHRDISPDNVLIDPNGTAVLIDFGAAHELAARADALGTELHMVKDGYSPQEFYVQNGAHSPSSDLYSLAATFYHVITGQAPPDSQTRLAAIAANKPDPLEPIPARSGPYDRYFLQAIHRALEVFESDRLATARDWLQLIEESLRQAALVEQARQDTLIDETIEALTRETNAAIAKAIEAQAQKRQEEARAAEEKAKAEKARKLKRDAMTAKLEDPGDAAEEPHPSRPKRRRPGRPPRPEKPVDLATWTPETKQH